MGHVPVIVRVHHTLMLVLVLLIAGYLLMRQRLYGHLGSFLSMTSRLRLADVAARGRPLRGRRLPLRAHDLAAAARTTLRLHRAQTAGRLGDVVVLRDRD